MEVSYQKSKTVAHNCYIYTVFLFSSSIILPVFNEGQLYMNLVLALSELEDSLQLLDREYMENENTV